MNTTEKDHTNHKWFVLYTAPRAEKRVAERLISLGYTSFLPMLSVRRKWSDRMKVVEIPMFNSYVFVNINPTMLLSLIKVDGVVKIVYYNGAPAVVRDCEVEIVKKYIKQAGVCEFIVGDAVEVVCGSLKGGERQVKGKIVKVKKDYLYLYVEQLGAEVCVKKCDVAGAVNVAV